MDCNKNSMTFPAVPVWSSKSTTNWVFFPMSAPLPSVGVLKIRVSFEMLNNSGAAKIRPVLRMSNDGPDWDAAVAIGTATRNADGTTYGSVYEDMGGTTSGKQLVQFGIQVQNDNGTDVEMCLASLRVDIE